MAREQNCSKAYKQTVRPRLALPHLCSHTRTEMAPFYRLVTSTHALPLDQALLDSLEAANAEELAKLDERLAEAEKTEGESDIADALRARANHFTQIGDKVRRARTAILRAC